MFNSYSISHGGITNELVFNSTSGTLVKSTPNSKIIRFHMTSKIAEMFFDTDKPYRYQDRSYPYEKKLVEVLQVMLCGGDNFLVEYLDIKADK